MKTLPTVRNISSSDVAKYFLFRSTRDGDLVTPLKMQKLVYYAYVRSLVKDRKRLFNEKIEAWANGPVFPKLYHSLKKYGSSPIDESFLEFKKKDDFNKLIQKFPLDVKKTLDEVYEEYMTRTAFELSVLSHSEKPWKKAREGLQPHESSNNQIKDDSILKFHSAGK